ncbi:hypothetical protein H6F71_05435 [Microcoleus sp. FACHB-61]|nr:hypothetical protein [Microcoleus sp. FACHB-61]
MSVDLVMAQVDRTMQILSGGYLARIRAIGQDNTRRLKPLLYKLSSP